MTAAVRDRLQRYLPRLVLAPSFVIVAVGVYGFILFTAYLSFTDSTILPSLNWVGIVNYQKLGIIRSWSTSIHNLVVFALLYIVICCAIGLLLAIFLDQKIRGEGVLRPIFLYPMALSFIVTGTAWKWFLDPGIGLTYVVQQWGWQDFAFDWIKDREMALYTIVIAAVWQTSGFVMAMFLAGLRGIDQSQIQAAEVDGASRFQIYWRIIIPQLGPVFLSAFVILGHMAIKSYDLVIAMTNGGPGTATWLPSVFMYQYSFTRNQMAVGAASAMIMLMCIAAIVVPYIYAETRMEDRHAA